MHLDAVNCGLLLMRPAAAPPLLHQAYDDIKKRRDGAPKSGRVSIVITDIESYSGETPALNAYVVPASGFSH